MSTKNRNMEHLTCKNIGGSNTAGDHSRARAVNACIRSLSAAKPELHYSVSAGCITDSCRFGGNKTLMVNDIKDRCFYKLRFHNRGNYFYNRFPGKNNSSFRNRVNISCKMKGAEIFQKILLKHIQAAKISHIFFCKTKIFDIFDHLLQSGCNGKAASAGIGTVKHIKNHGLVCRVFEVTLHHGQFIEISEQSEISCSHIMSPLLRMLFVCFIILC